MSLTQTISPATESLTERFIAPLFAGDRTGALAIVAKLFQPASASKSFSRSQHETKNFRPPAPHRHRSVTARLPCSRPPAASPREIVGWIGQLQPQVLMVYGTIPSGAPMVRQLIDLLHDVGIGPKLQIMCSGGVFNRAEGLAEEIGSDLFAPNPIEALEILDAYPNKRPPPAADRRPQSPHQEQSRVTEPVASPVGKARGRRAARRVIESRLSSVSSRIRCRCAARWASR